jgi:hypothetical protein
MSSDDTSTGSEGASGRGDGGAGESTPMTNDETTSFAGGAAHPRGRARRLRHPRN